MNALTEGEAELAVGFFWDVPASLIDVLLYEHGYLVAGRPEVLGAGPLAVERHAALPHVPASPGRVLHGMADDALAAQGLTRRVAAAIPQFLAALAAAAEAGCIVALPDRLATRYGPAFGLRVVPPPLTLRSFTVSALRHRRNERDGRLLWIIERLKQDEQPPGGRSRI